jgi:hypothetical protein
VSISSLISSRLTSYLNRTWPAVSPCPLAKYQSQVHPRPLYYFLTTQPHQPIPELLQPHEIPLARRIITPDLSSAADDEDEKYSRSRASLSPEVDLSSPELDEPPHGDIGSTFRATRSRVTTPQRRPTSLTTAALTALLLSVKNATSSRRPTPCKSCVAQARKSPSPSRSRMMRRLPCQSKLMKALLTRPMTCLMARITSLHLSALCTI